MHAASFLFLFLFAAVCAPPARAQVLPPLPGCSTLSAPLVLASAVPAGSVYSTVTTCTATPQFCGCIPSTQLPYGVSIAKSINGTSCVCDYTILHATPGGVISLRGCAQCP